MICVSMKHILTPYHIFSDPLPAVSDREGEAVLVLYFTMYPTIDSLNRPLFFMTHIPTPHDISSDSLLAVYDREGEAAVVLGNALYPTMDVLNSTLRPQYNSHLSSRAPLFVVM